MPASLSIGVFTDDFYPESGGVTRSIELQLTALVEAGHRVTLFAPALKFTPPTVGEWREVPYWRLPGTPSYLCSLQARPALARKIAAVHRLDLVHTQNERGSIFLGAQVAALLQIPQVHTFHSNYVGTHHTSPLASGLNSLAYLDWSGRWLRRTTGTTTALPASDNTPGDPSDPRFAARDWRSLARLASATDAFTSPAAYLVESIEAASGGALTGKGHVVPSGISEVFSATTRHRPPSGPVRFLSVGRLGPEKRVDAILEAFDLLGRDDAELHIVGTGAAEAALRTRAARIKHGTVRFLGHFDSTTAIAQEVADADVFVLASHRFDTQGLVLAEAAAAGTPILYCDDRLSVGVSAQNALLTGPSPAELATGMAALADDPVRRMEMSAAGRRLAPSLTVQRMGERYLEVYRSVLDNIGH